MNHDARAPEETVLDLPPVVPARSACKRPSTRRPQSGVPGTRITPRPAASSSVARRNNRRKHSLCPPLWAGYPGTWRKTSSEPKALISLGLWAHSCCALRKTSARLPHTESRRRESRPCNWNFTNSIGAGSICGCAIPPGSAAFGLAGRLRPAHAHRGGGRPRPARPLPGHGRLQAHRGAPAIGPGHAGSGGLADG